MTVRLATLVATRVLGMTNSIDFLEITHSTISMKEAQPVQSNAETAGSQETTNETTATQLVMTADPKTENLKQDLDACMAIQLRQLTAMRFEAMDEGSTTSETTAI